jgi:hypothetical protein
MLDAGGWGGGGLAVVDVWLEEARGLDGGERGRVVRHWRLRHRASGLVVGIAVVVSICCCGSRWSTEVAGSLSMEDHGMSVASFCRGTRLEALSWRHSIGGVLACSALFLCCLQQVPDDV